jgi:hypothetical protein
MQWIQTLMFAALALIAGSLLGAGAACLAVRRNLRASHAGEETQRLLAAILMAVFDEADLLRRLMGNRAIAQKD